MTLQEHYSAIKSGKGNKDQFLKQAKNLFPEYFNQYTDFDTATNVLKSKQIISEAAGGVVAKGFDIYDWKKILAEETKATEKETSKEVLDDQNNAYPNSDMKNADNVNFNEIMKGFYAEMRDEKNAGKTGDEIKAMVVKNLAKDPLFYTKDGMFGTKGVGYTTEAPGLGTPKEPKGKHKASGYGDLDADIKIEKVKSNVQDSLGDREANTSNPKKVKEMPDKGVTGVEKKMKLQEAMDQGPVSIKGKTGPTGGTQKIPRALFLDKEVISTINDAQPGSVKLISKPGDKRVYMYVSSFVKNALDELERGRSSREKLKKQSKLADVLADKLPSAIRGKIKKEINPKMDSGLKMHYVDLNISPKKDKTGYWVLAKGESAPLVAEEQNKKLTILGTEKAMSMLKSELKNNGVKFETNGNKVIVDDSPKAKMAVKMVKERVGMQSIKLNENFNWDRISAEDASKLFDYHERTGMLPSNLSAEKYDEIMKKYRISRQDDSDIPFKSMTEGEQKLRSLIRNIIKEELNEYGEDSGGQDMTSGMYGRSITKKDQGNKDFINKGKEDFINDVPFEACPYEKGYNEYYKADLAKLWQMGWKEAEAKAKDRLPPNADKDIPFQGMTEESKYEDTMPKYRLGALKKLLDASIKDGSPQDVITHLQNAIQSLEKQA